MGFGRMAPPNESSISSGNETRLRIPANTINVSNFFNAHIVFEALYDNGYGFASLVFLKSQNDLAKLERN